MTPWSDENDVTPLSVLISTPSPTSSAASLISCSLGVPSEIFVDLTITNINQGYEKHFSFDEEGMLPITFVFLFIYIICFTGQCILQPKINFDSRARTTRNTRNQYRKSINKISEKIINSNR